MKYFSELLERGGVLDANGMLISDSNEALRRVWDKRMKTDANSFYEDITYPEDTATANYGQVQSSTSANTSQARLAKVTQSNIIDKIRSVVNGEIYHHRHKKFCVTLS